MPEKTKSSSAELMFAWGWQQFYSEQPQPIHDQTFIKGRRYRPDFRWPNEKVIVEIEGGSFIPGGGRHNRAAGFEADCAKYNLFAEHGYLILRFTTQMIDRDLAEVLEQVRRVVQQRGSAF